MLGLCKVPSVLLIVFQSIVLVYFWKSFYTARKDRMLLGFYESNGQILYKNIKYTDNKKLTYYLTTKQAKSILLQENKNITYWILLDGQNKVLDVGL